MNRFIRGKRYNTDTARLVGSCENGPSLYRKKTGEYFLAIDGQIDPRPYQEAREWALINLDTQTYLREFDHDQSRELVHVSHYLTRATAGRLRQAAQAAGMQPSEFLESLLSKVL